jgi:putative MATE family efflux protein
MDQTARSAASAAIDYAPLPLLERDSNRALLRELLVLAMPVFAEHVLHILVGWNDTYLANHVHRFEIATAASRADEVAAGAAVGSISYILWFVGIMVSAVGTGSTAIIARAVGARHRSLANSICGQSISLAILIGIFAGASMFFFAPQIADATGLSGDAHRYAYEYLRILALSMPFSMTMFVANPCLRGAGDTLTPAITMIVVDIINMFFSFAMTYGWFWMPKLGFDGIAWGTAIAYVAGGVIQFCVLLVGRGGIRLYLHRMRPHWHNLKRLLRIGIPGGIADVLNWVGNFGVLLMVNQMGAAQGNAHNISIRIESLSYMMGFAVATACTTMVGQSLGIKRPHRAERSAYVSYGVGGGIMILAGIGFILLGKYPAMLFSDDPVVRAMVTRCLFITGFIQSGFAAAFVFGGALRGAGDTFSVMVISTSSIFGIRLSGVFVAAKIFHLGLAGVWVVLASELMLRGILLYIRFAFGQWKKIQV